MLNARVDQAGYDEHEVARLDEALLDALSRPPGPVTRDAWRTSDASDARWVWLVALVLLGVEQWLRARSTRHPQRRSRVPPREWPDRTADLVRDLAAIARRMRVEAALQAIAVGLPAAAVVDVLLRRSGMSVLGAGALAIALLAGLAGAWLRRIRLRWTPAAAARAVEVAHPSSRNVVITAEELLRHPERAAPSITARVLHESAEITGAIDRRQVVPLMRPAALCDRRIRLRGGSRHRRVRACRRVVVQAVQQAVARAGPDRPVR